MKFEKIPGRAFLDTTSLNFILKYGEYIFDGVIIPSKILSNRIIKDINSFYNIFWVKNGEHIPFSIVSKKKGGDYWWPEMI